MVKLLVNLAIAVWLFVSAFVLPRSIASGWNAAIVGVLVATVALFAYVAVGRPGTRWLNAVLATWLFVSTMIVPHVSLGALANDAVIACVLAIVTLVPSHRWAGSGAEHAARPA